MHNDQDVAAYIGSIGGSPARGATSAGGGGPVEALALEQRPHVCSGWVAQLRDRLAAAPWGSPSNKRRGAVIHALMQYEFLVLYPVNPTALARYRQAFHPSGAKDDPTDAALLLDLLRKHRDQLRPGDRIRSRRASSSCSPSTGRKLVISARRPDQPAHQPTQAVFPPGPRLGRRARLAPSVRLSRQVAHAGRRPARAPRHRAPVLSAAQLPPRPRDRHPGSTRWPPPSRSPPTRRSSTRSVSRCRPTRPNSGPCSRPSTPSRARSPRSSPPTPTTSSSRVSPGRARSASGWETFFLFLFRLKRHVSSSFVSSANSESRKARFVFAMLRRVSIAVGFAPHLPRFGSRYFLHLSLLVM